MTTPLRETRKPIRLAVIQMARLGDSVQSLMALRAAKQLYPELEITVVTHEQFAQAVHGTSWIQKVIPFPSDAILAPVMTGKRSISESLPLLASWVEPLIEQPWDLAVNWTFSEPTSFLLGLLPARVKLGYSRRKSGEFRNADGWSHYIQSVVQSDTQQGIHLTDILTTQLLTALQVHFGDPVDPGSSSVTSKSFFSNRRDQVVCDGWNSMGRRWIALQLSSPRDSQAWASKDWAAFIARILQRHDEVSVIVLGSQQERPVEREFLRELHSQLGSTARFAGRIVSKVGVTPFDLWVKILADAQWVISAETPALHVASVLGSRVFHVSSGDERFMETGPYGNAHYIVKDSSPLVAYGAWTYANTEWQHRRSLSIGDHFTRLQMRTELSAAKIYRSKIRPTDEGGGVFYEPLIERSLTLDGWLSQAVSHLAREWYCGWVPPIRQELSKQEITPALMQTLRKILEGTDVLDRILGEGARTAGELESFTSKLKSEKLMRMSDRERIQEFVGKLKDLEDLIGRVGDTQLPLAFFSRLTKVLMANLDGEKLTELSADTAEAYRFLRVGSEGIRNWVTQTLEIAKPTPLTHSAQVIPLRTKVDPSL